MTRVCHRCGRALMLNLVGVPQCFPCIRRDRAEVVACFTQRAERVGQVHRRVLDVSEADAPAAGAK